MKKFLACLMCCLLLCGCTVSMNGTENNNTTSNITESTTHPSTEDNDLAPSANTTQAPSATQLANINDYSTSKVIWGPGNIENHQVPTDPASLEKSFSSLGGKWLLDNKNQVCLTFDEGYENGFTPSILDTLKEKKVKAIFFVTYDFAKDNPDLIKRMIDEGHIVGNHTYRHYTMDEIDLDTAKEEVMTLHNYIKKEYNYTMSYFRFPKGEFSQQSLALVNQLGYKSVFWSFAYADWDTSNPPDNSEALTKICESTHPGEIILLHAVCKTNADILGSAIDDIRQQGYTFTTEL